MADVLALVDDLFFQSKMMETAKQVGVALRVVSSGDALVQAAAAQTPALVLVDLNARQGRPRRAHAVVRGGPDASRRLSLPRADGSGRAGARSRVRAGAPALEIYGRSRRNSAPGQILMAVQRRMRARWALVALLLVPAVSAGARAGRPVICALAPPAEDPAAGFAGALSAACRQDHAAFATHLTAENAAAFRALPEPQQTALLKRFVLLDDPGRPLLSNSAGGNTEVRCESAGLVADMHLSAAEVHENLAFVTAAIGQPGEEPRPVRIGFVREGGQWKLLSVGLLLLDLPAMARQWQEADLQQSENEAIASLAKIAEALDKYQQAFGKLPEALEQLGPPAGEGASPEHADFVAADLAAGASGGYGFRYVVKPATTEAENSDPENAADFVITGTPIEYGKAGRRSFYLDSDGTLRGADKHGLLATASDPRDCRAAIAHSANFPLAASERLQHNCSTPSLLPGACHRPGPSSYPKNGTDKKRHWMEKVRSNPPVARAAPYAETTVATSPGTQTSRSWPNTERRGGVRYTVSADAVVVDARSRTRLRGRASDLSLSGCYLDAISLFAVDTSVGLQLTGRRSQLRVRGSRSLLPAWYGNGSGVHENIRGSSHGAAALGRGIERGD